MILLSVTLTGGGSFAVRILANAMEEARRSGPIGYDLAANKIYSDTVPNEEAPQAFGLLGFAQLPGKDSNLDKENQNLLCYRYTTG